MSEKDVSLSRRVGRRELLTGIGGAAVGIGSTVLLHNLGLIEVGFRSDTNNGNVKDTISVIEGTGNCDRKDKLIVVPEEVETREVIISSINGEPRSRRITINVASGDYTDNNYYTDEPNPPNSAPDIPVVIEKSNQLVQSVNKVASSDRKTMTMVMIVEGSQDYIYSFIDHYKDRQIVFYIPQDVPFGLKLFEVLSFQTSLYLATGDDHIENEYLSDHILYLREDWESKKGRYLGGWANYEHDGEEIATEIGTLSNIVDFSRYMDLDYFHYYNHPSFAGNRRLVINTLTVMRFFPKSFMTTVESLGEQDRTVLKEIAIGSVEGLKNVAINKKGAEDLFDPELLAYLRS